VVQGIIYNDQSKGFSSAITSNPKERHLMNLEELLDYLKELGVRVPVLFYSNYELEDTAEMRLKRKYDMFSAARSLIEVEAFCAMNPLSHFQ